MSRSPIKILIDRAVGITEENAVSLLIELRCPQCGRSQKAHRDETDPPRARVVLGKCPDCHPGTFEPLRYLDASGREI